jgi:hypothetical protein
MNTEQVPRPANADADLVAIWGRLPFSVRRAIERVTEKSAGVVVMACWQRNPGATREILTNENVCQDETQPVAREGQNWVRKEVGEARSTIRSPVTRAEGRGLGLVMRQEEEKTRRLA